jgi:hypothetical protein
MPKRLRIQIESCFAIGLISNALMAFPNLVETIFCRPKDTGRDFPRRCRGATRLSRQLREALFFGRVVS